MKAGHWVAELAAMSAAQMVVLWAALLEFEWAAHLADRSVAASVGYLVELLAVK